jgi:hypothetical protein
LDESGVSVRRRSAARVDRFEGGLEALRIIPGNQHGVPVTGTPELFAFLKRPADHASSFAGCMFNKGRQDSRFINFVGSNTSGIPRPFAMILVIAILAS